MSDTHRIESLPVLVLYPHSRCNCRCIMCDIWKIGTVEEIGISDLERHARDIEALGVRWAVFSGGEPLMHSDLFRLSERMRERGIRTTILSNGLLLSRNASAAVRSVDDVILSLDRGIQRGAVREGCRVILASAGIGFIYGAALIQWGPAGKG